MNIVPVRIIVKMLSRLAVNALPGLRLAPGLAAMVLLSCGQGPSFVEDSTVDGKNSSRSSGSSSIDGVDGQSNPDGTKGPSNGDSTASSASSDPNQDPTKKPVDDRIVPIPVKEKVYNNVVIEKSYNADVTAPGSVLSDLDSAYLMSQVTLRRGYSSESRTTNQITRQRLNDMYAQGYAPSNGDENFTQREQRPLDLLVVIDNSGSMQEEQNNLAKKLDPLLTYIADSDWQIGVVTTDPSDGCLRSLIRKGDANIAQKFENAINAGTKGDAVERGVLQAYNSLKGTCLTQPWIRANSTVAVLIVSDEDNCSNGAECGNTAPHRNGSYLLDYLSSIRTLGRNARVYGIFKHPSQSDAQCPTARNTANIYAQMVTATNGDWGSICASDYSNTLLTISKNISGILASRFTLKTTPNANSLQVYVNDSLVTSGYTLMNNMIDFAVAPSDTARIHAVYKYDGKPIVSRFHLTGEPFNPNDLSIAIAGVAADPTTYTYDAVANDLVFSTPPAERSTLSIMYKRNDSLKREFALTGKVKAGSLKIYVNNVATTAFQYMDQAAKIVFDEAPGESAAIRIDFTAVGDPIYSYAFNVNGGAPKTLSAYDTNAQTPVDVTWALNNVVVSPGSWLEGRNVTLKYANPARDRMTVSLPHMPIASTLRATDGVTVCMGTGKVSLAGQDVLLQNCGFSPNSSSIDVSYTYIAEVRQSFTFVADGLPSDETPQTWKVWVNNVERADYSRTKNVFTFPTALPQGSVVRIQVTFKKLSEDK